MKSKNIKVLIASDSFKGSASSMEIANYISEGIKRVDPEIQTILLEIADGGEGTVDAITKAKQGQLFTKEVTGPMGQPVNAKYGLFADKQAVIEVAETSGLTQVDSQSLDPFQATSYGLGELIKYLIEEKGVKDIYVGLGGSACNDGGIGLLQALGGKILDKEGHPVQIGAQGLKEISQTELDVVDHLLKEVNIEVLSDVTNPLIGVNGATYIFGKQKGVKVEELPIIDQYMNHYREKVLETFNVDLDTIPGAGAAGGLGAALGGLCGATMRSGIDKVLELIDLKSKVEQVELVITGEGSMDAQSLYGKAPIGIAKIAKKYHKPVIAIVGSVGDDLTSIYQSDIDLIIDIINRPMTLEEAMSQTQTLVENAGENAIRSFLL
ncbi:glycerate kinase [Aerococcaceae bacterium WGS1372]